ncbi:MAG: RidA family protein [Gammaproteobacteria bacterium]|nr:RidA family protein [Gammaproteobacteria bacterium]
MNAITRIETDERSSRVVIFNKTVFIGGMTAKDRSQSIKGQTKQVLARIEGYLAHAGTDISHLLTAHIWLKDITRDFAAMNEVWNAWTAPGAAPTRATAQCLMASPEVLIEIVVTAALPE